MVITLWSIGRWLLARQFGICDRVDKEVEDLAPEQLAHQFGSRSPGRALSYTPSRRSHQYPAPQSYLQAVRYVCFGLSGTRGGTSKVRSVMVRGKCRGLGHIDDEVSANLRRHRIRKGLTGGPMWSFVGIREVHSWRPDIGLRPVLKPEHAWCRGFFTLSTPCCGSRRCRHSPVWGSRGSVSCRPIGINYL
jgi:hypothetical protein